MKQSVSGYVEQAVFIKQFVRERPGQAVLWNRVTEFRGASHVCKLKTNLISFLGWRAQVVDYNRYSPDIECDTYNIPSEPENICKAEPSGFISDVWPYWAVQSEREWSRQERQVFQVMLAALWSGLVNPALFIGKSHALKACFYLINVTIVS